MGMSASVVNRDEAISDKDVRSRRRERWLRSEEERRKMEQSLLAASFPRQLDHRKKSVCFEEAGLLVSVW